MAQRTVSRRLLARDGMFVFETQHGADVIRRMLIDTIYHEHLSYFLLGPMVPFSSARHGMELFAVRASHYQGRFNPRLRPTRRRPA